MRVIAVFFFLFLSFALWANQIILRGKVTSASDGESLIGANIIIKGTQMGTVTDGEGKFQLVVTNELPVVIEVSYVGFQTREVEVADEDRIHVKLKEDLNILDAIEVKGRRISEKRNESPLTVESLDFIAIRETPAANFYDGLGALKEVDLTAASLGFKIVNTRGFNSTSPVRSLQVIDGVDNQSPGLNFSLGNFLGSSELDTRKVDIIVGASSSYYGPGAFNGVIDIQTLDPFLHSGLSAQVKFGERNLFEGSIRYADQWKNREGMPSVAYKLNFTYLRADDWEAENYSVVDGTETSIDNPGRYDAVNIYGDEYFSLNDVTGSQSWYWADAGLGEFHRTGYREVDLVDYDTRNFKTNLAVHLRLKPEQQFESPELIFASSIGGGTTVYQGDNRFSLRDILFFQHRIELRKEGSYFLRAYMTHEDAGKSFDPYFTALKLQELAKDDQTWALDYRRYWKNVADYPAQMRSMGYPRLMFNPDTGMFSFDFELADQWLEDNREMLTMWHVMAEAYANQESEVPGIESSAYFRPGTPEFAREFSRITSTKSNNKEDGTLFFDRSALYHLHGEYQFDLPDIDNIRLGINGRLYRPNSEGTIFTDGEKRITNYELGIYGGITKKFLSDRFSANLTLRVDKNENLRWLVTPSASLVFSPADDNYLRISFASALRNPTLTDQYLQLDVGRAILAGNIDGVDSLITVESFIDYLGNNRQVSRLEFFDIDRIKPEQVRTIELGYRTILWNDLFLDVSYYHSTYRDFLGYLVGIDALIDFDDPLSFPEDVVAYRYAANSASKVQTEGASIGMNLYFSNYYVISGNYSYNKLVKSAEDDPIIPAFNTPEHKFNIGFSGRDIPLSATGSIRNMGFNINYKWVDGFLFEGSPQFTGFIDSYGALDAQVNVSVPDIHSTIKVGASNILDNQHYQAYGGPLIGRLAYISLSYNFKKH